MRLEDVSPPHCAGGEAGATHAKAVEVAAAEPPLAGAKRKRPAANGAGADAKPPKKRRTAKRPPPPPPPSSIRLLFVDVGIKNFGWAVGRVERCARTADDPLLGGFALRLSELDVMDALEEGAAVELAAAGVAAEAVNANKLAIADIVRWTAAAAHRRLTALLAVPVDEPPAVDAVVIEVQPMGAASSNLAAQKAMAARNTKTKALSHVLQALVHLVDGRVPVHFASPHARAASYKAALPEGSAAAKLDYGQRKKASKVAAAAVVERSGAALADDGAAVWLGTLRGRGKVDDMADAALGLFVHGRAALVEAGKRRRADAAARALRKKLPLRVDAAASAKKSRERGGGLVGRELDPDDAELAALEEEDW